MGAWKVFRWRLHCWLTFQNANGKVVYGGTPPRPGSGLPRRAGRPRLGSVNRPSVRTVRRLALASVVANAGIVVTGGAVRLTDSGLGCPDWPRCNGGV